MESKRLTVKVPDNFDPGRHGAQMLQQITEKKGPGWQIENFDPDRRMLTFSQVEALTTVRDATSQTKTVGLGGSPKPSDAERVARRLAEQHPGFYMTHFDPFLARAELTKLTDDEVRCRGAVAAALSVKPWEVKVAPRPGGGFKLGLPDRYMPSKHDDKLQEVAESVVGKLGWFCRVDAKTLEAEIVPSDPPMFPPLVDLFDNPFEAGGRDVTPFGESLPEAGAERGEVVSLDWAASAFTLLAGVPGSGKSVTLNDTVFSQLVHGVELVVVDDAGKAVDFAWCKPYVREHGWGCESLAGAATALALVHREGQRRAALLAQWGYNNWLNLPPDLIFTPILVMVDEVSALTVPSPVPRGIPKDHPLVVEATQENVAKAFISSYINKIISELRFVGVRLVLSTQATNANTGVPPSMRNKIGNFILMGNSPSKSARMQIFPDESAIPTVPDHVQAAGKLSKGVGVALMEGRPPVVFKSMFADIKVLEQKLAASGLPRTGSSPTQAQIDSVLPSLEDDADAAKEQLDTRRRRPPELPEDDPRKGLSGFELANMNRHLAAGGKPTAKQKAEARQESAWAEKSGEVTSTQMDRCPACDAWIHPGTGGCRCAA